MRPVLEHVKKNQVCTSEKKEKSRVKFIVTGTLVGSNLTRYNQILDTTKSKLTMVAHARKWVWKI